MSLPKCPGIPFIYVQCHSFFPWCCPSHVWHPGPIILRLLASSVADQDLFPCCSLTLSNSFLLWNLSGPFQNWTPMVPWHLVPVFLSLQSVNTCLWKRFLYSVPYIVPSSCWHSVPTFLVLSHTCGTSREIPVLNTYSCPGIQALPESACLNPDYNQPLSGPMNLTWPWSQLGCMQREKCEKGWGKRSPFICCHLHPPAIPLSILIATCSRSEI